MAKKKYVKKNLIDFVMKYVIYIFIDFQLTVLVIAST